MIRTKSNRPYRLISRGFKIAIRFPLKIAFQGFWKIFPVQDDKDWVDVTYINLMLPNLDPEFHGYRLVQISDIHIGTWLTNQHLANAVQLINQQNPDLIAITGDFVTYEPELYAGDLVAELSKLSPRDAVVAVLGNHDHWTNPKVVRDILYSSNIIDLSNDVYTLKRDYARLHIAGVDDIIDELDCLDQVLEKVPSDGSAILLAHEPDYADISASRGRFDLQISGHTHGGQIILPIIGAPFLPRLGRKYPSGLYRVNGMIHYTNRGLGTAEVQVRYKCRPEITVFTLEVAGISMTPASITK